MPYRTTMPYRDMGTCAILVVPLDDVTLPSGGRGLCPVSAGGQESRELRPPDRLPWLCRT